MKNRLIVPDINRLRESVDLAKELDAAFEYNDFFRPELIDDEKECEAVILKYLSLDRDRSDDTLHGAFFDLAPASSDPKVRELTLFRMRQSMDIAKRLGVRAVIFHTNYIDMLLPSSYRKLWLRSYEDLIRGLLSDYPELDIYLENMFDTNPILLSQLANCLRDEPRFGVCFDLAHAVITKTPLSIWFDHLAPYIRHMHINDTDGIEDSHYVVGTGSISWNEYQNYLDKYHLRPGVLLEVKGPVNARKSADFLRCADIYPFRRSDDDMIQLNDEMKNLLNIGISLTSEKSYSKLLDMIIERAMEVTCSDAGTLYLLEPDGLRFIIMHNKTLNKYQGSAGEPVDLPKVPLTNKNVCSYCALHRQIVNIRDVYDCNEFDFSGPRDYDKLTGYHTQSMLVIPLENHEGVVLGVLQLINAKDADNSIIPYTWDDEYVVYSMASQTSVTMSNMQYIKEIKGFLYSVVSVMTTAIEEQTPYNANHTYNVARYTSELVDYINNKHARGECDIQISSNHKEQLVLASYLHDIGKLVVPLDVMNKMSRLGVRRSEVLHRFEMIRLYMKVDFLEGRMDRETYDERNQYIDESLGLIDIVDTIPKVTDQTIEKLKEISSQSYTKPDGTVLFYLNAEELNCLSVKSGTLTERERAIMENHVATTSKLLEKMQFGKDYSHVAEWAASHHEYLDGTGYPNHLAGDEISPEVRILIVVDIYEALTSVDRPYKRSCTREQAFKILEEMASHGKIDGQIVKYLEDYMTETYPEEF